MRAHRTGGRPPWRSPAQSVGAPPSPRQVLHTGERAKGWGLFAARRIVRGEFLGHYSGVLVDIG